MQRIVFGVVLTTVVLCLLGWLLFLVSFHRTQNVAARGVFPAGPSFMDLTVYVTRFEVFRTREFFLLPPPNKPRSLFAYPPGAALCYRLLYRWQHRELFYNVLFFTWLAGLMVFTWRTLSKGVATSRCAAAVCSLGLLSYPLWFLFQRANIEIFLWILLFLSALAYRQERFLMAAIGIGMAASIKLYPVLLLGLFLKERKQWTALLVGLATAVAATAVEIWRCAPGFFLFGARGFFGGVSQFQSKYAASTQGGNGEFDHSLFDWVKSLAMHTGMNPASFTLPYYLICGGTALLVYLVWLREKPFLNRLTYLLILMVLLPPVSFTYTLVHLYLPLLLLLALTLRSSRQLNQRLSTASLVALISLSFLLLPIDLFGPLVRSAGKITVLPLLLALGASVVQPWTEADAAERPAAA